MVLLATCMEFGSHWVGRVSGVTGGTWREIKAAASGCWVSGIDADRVLHSND